MKKITLSIMGIAVLLLMTSIDLYSQSYRETASMNQSRDWCAMVKMDNGNIFVCGGMTSGTPSMPTKTAEIYDPSSETWTQVADMNLARHFHTATLMNDGRIFVHGGVNGSMAEERTGEIYDPTTDTWTTTTESSCPHNKHSAILLSDGSIWVTGGGCTQSEIYYPATDTFIIATDITTGTYSTSGTLIEHTDGQFFIIGGHYPSESNGDGALIQSSGDPGAGSTWTSSANTMAAATTKASVFLLSIGKYAVVEDYGGVIHTFDPVTYTFGAAGPTYGNVPRHAAGSTQLMADGGIIAFGGYDILSELNGTGTRTIQVYDWSTNSWTNPPYTYADRLPVFTASVRLDNGLILALGGTKDFQPSAQCYLIDEDGIYTAIDDVEDQGFAPKLYPNPAQDMLQVELSLQEPADINISISDMLGKELSALSKYTSAGSVTQQLDVAGYPSGLYTITVESNGNTYSQPFVKQ